MIFHDIFELKKLLVINVQLEHTWFKYVENKFFSSIYVRGKDIFIN